MTNINEKCKFEFIWLISTSTFLTFLENNTGRSVITDPGSKFLISFWYFSKYPFAFFDPKSEITRFRWRSFLVTRRCWFFQITFPDWMTIWWLIAQSADVILNSQLIGLWRNLVNERKLRNFRKHQRKIRYSPKFGKKNLKFSINE